MFSDSNNSKVNLEGFVLKKDGEFIELKGSMFGNKDSLNPFTKLDVITDYQGELFARSWERSMLLNTNSGLFLYSHLDVRYNQIVTPEFVATQNWKMCM